MRRFSSSSAFKQSMRAPSCSFDCLCAERIDFLGGGLEAFGHVLERNGPRAPRLVERAVARNRRHPGERRAFIGIKVAGALPNANERVLQRFAARVIASQDAHDHAVKLCLGELVKARKRR